MRRLDQCGSRQPMHMSEYKKELPELPTWTHRETKLGNLFSSKWGRFRLSAAAFRFLGAAGFLNGSTPDDLVQT